MAPLSMFIITFIIHGERSYWACSAIDTDGAIASFYKTPFARSRSCRFISVHPWGVDNGKRPHGLIGENGEAAFRLVICSQSVTGSVLGVKPLC